MPQYKKDLVQQQIKDSALDLFSAMGYLQTTVADISQASKVSIGNIYRYYPAKSDILDELINAEFFEKLKVFIKEKIRNNPSSSALLNYIIENKEIFLLAFNGLKGTKYETYVDEIIDYMTELVMEKIGNNEEKLHRALVRRIYLNYMDTLRWITLNVEEESEFMKYMDELNMYHMLGMIALLKKGD